MSITQMPFGTTKDGHAVTLFRLENASGAFVEVLDYGCTLRAVWVPDKENRLTDVCLGYDTIVEYETYNAYIGALVGRCANRISNARFSLGDKEYRLSENAPKSHLHGGVKGFSMYVWNHKIEGDTLVLSRISPDGEEGYPGTLAAEARYTFDEQNQLVLELSARTEGDTIVNLTNHAYWNLAGHGGGDVGGHTLRVAASAITENDDTACSTGAFLSVEGTPFDLKTPKRLADGWNTDHPQIVIGGGYDHNFVLEGDGMRTAAVLSCPASGISMTLATTQPGLQVYTSNSLTPRKGKGGAHYDYRTAVALEAQAFPNAANIPHFPKVTLHPEEPYHQTIAFRFAIKEEA